MFDVDHLPGTIRKRASLPAVFVMEMESLQKVGGMTSINLLELAGKKDIDGVHRIMLFLNK
jgi:hypothetical protein